MAPCEEEEEDICEDAFDLKDLSSIQNSALSSVQDSKINFILGSGAKNHWVSQTLEKFMKDIQVMEQPSEIKIANGAIMKGTKRAILRLQDLNNKTNKYGFINISATIVPATSFNILSVKCLCSKGFDIKFNKREKTVTICNESLQINCSLKSNLYIAQFTVPDEISKACHISTSDGHLWHQRLGHLSAQGLQHINFPNKFDICSACKQGKAKRQPFKNVEMPRSSTIGELTRSEISGPCKTHTMNGEKYFQRIIDDYSHFVRIHLLKSKNEAEGNLMIYV